MSVTKTESTLRTGAVIAGGWLIFAALLLLAAQSSSLTITWTTFALLVGSLLMNAISFATFAWDKRQAVDDGWRTAEFTLHMLTLLGGWSGSFLAQRWLRHKSQKFIFQITAWCGFALHLLAVVSWWGWR